MGLHEQNISWSEFVLVLLKKKRESFEVKLFVLICDLDAFISRNIRKPICLFSSCLLRSVHCAAFGILMSFSSRNSILPVIHMIRSFLKVCFTWLFSLNSVQYGSILIYFFPGTLPLAPSTTNTLPEDYVERVKRVHESGGYGSRGYDMHPNLHFIGLYSKLYEHKLRINFLWQVWIWMEKRWSKQKPSTHSHNCCFLQDALLASTGMSDFVLNFLL